MSCESSAEPIKVGYLMDFTLPPGFPEELFASFTQTFDLIFQEAVTQGQMDRPVLMIYREVERLPKGSVKAVIDAYGELVDEGCLVVFGPNITDNCVPLREAIEELRRHRVLGLRLQRRAEVRVAERRLRHRAAAQRVRLVLVREARAETRRAARDAELELLHARDLDVLRQAVRARDAVVVRPPVVRAEERRAVAPQRELREVAILVVQLLRDVVAQRPRLGLRRRGGGAGRITGVERR